MQESLNLVPDRLNQAIAVPYVNIVAFEIGGPGARKTGGGFFGGGFGGSGAAEGMLVPAALNMLTTRTKVDTVICVQTPEAELFVHNARRRLTR